MLTPRLYLAIKCELSIEPIKYRRDDTFWFAAKSPLFAKNILLELNKNAHSQPEVII